ncbi:Putative F-box protein At3g16210 [Linum perenne]
MHRDGGKKTNKRGVAYLTEDLVIKILLRLPEPSCIARFRCVCRSWRNLLSDPDLIRKIIFFQSSDDQKTLQILITGVWGRIGLPPFRYISYSYETFRPITDHRHLITSGGGAYKLIGCCDGIFCLSNTTRYRNGRVSHDVVVWNPVTSETKILPPGPSHPACSRRQYEPLELDGERTGFGFDPQTNDYKFIRVMEFELSRSSYREETEYDPHEIHHGDTPLVFTEVYSLRNDSWRTVNVSNKRIFARRYSSEVIHLRQQRDTSRNEKCYWFAYISGGDCCLVSFDMSTEVFEYVTFVHPPGFHFECWCLKSCFMSKGVIVATFTNTTYKSKALDEKWALLKYGVTHSWTKLFTSERDTYINHLEVWKNGTHICSRGDFSPKNWTHSEIFKSDLATGKVIRDRIETESINFYFQSCIFTPTQASLSLG